METFKGAFDKISRSMAAVIKGFEDLAAAWTDDQPDSEETDGS